MRFSVIYDACVLYPAPLRDFLMRLALPDPNDRHVLAAAIVAGAQLIVTFNLKDFPNDYLTTFGIEAVHPDDFIVQQFDLHEARVINAAKSHRGSLRNPPKNVGEYLDTLAAQGLVVTVDRLRDYQDFI